jgi:peptidoglycan/xylan/chitin deacetylase (PgdA/CDA1 family)
MIQTVRSAARRLVASAYDRAPHVLARLRGRVLILCYHRVLADGEERVQFVQPGMYTRLHVLETHLRFLREHFDIISFTDFLRLRTERAWDPDARYCLLTFDDGWVDNYVHAYPLLRRYEARATIFVSTALIGSEAWTWPDTLGWLLTRSGLDVADIHDRLRPLQARYPWVRRLRRSIGAATVDTIIESCKRMGERAIADLILEVSGRLGVEVPKRRVFLHWWEIEEMSAAGIEFGAHGATHRLLPGLSNADLRREVAGSFDALAQPGVNQIPVFAYPNGDYDDAVVGLVRASGYHAAVSTIAGAEQWETSDLFRLKRIAVHDDVSSTLGLFAYHIAQTGCL